MVPLRLFIFILIGLLKVELSLAAAPKFPTSEPTVTITFPPTIVPTKIAPTRVPTTVAPTRKQQPSFEPTNGPVSSSSKEVSYYVALAVFFLLPVAFSAIDYYKFFISPSTKKFLVDLTWLTGNHFEEEGSIVCQKMGYFLFSEIGVLMYVLMNAVLGIVFSILSNFLPRIIVSITSAASIPFMFLFMKYGNVFVADKKVPWSVPLHLSLLCSIYVNAMISIIFITCYPENTNSLQFWSEYLWAIYNMHIFITWFQCYLIFVLIIYWPFMICTCCTGNFKVQCVDAFNVMATINVQFRRSMIPMYYYSRIKNETEDVLTFEYTDYFVNRIIIPKPHRIVQDAKPNYIQYHFKVVYPIVNGAGLLEYPVDEVRESELTVKEPGRTDYIVTTSTNPMIAVDPAVTTLQAVTIPITDNSSANLQPNAVQNPK